MSVPGGQYVVAADAKSAARAARALVRARLASLGLSAWRDDAELTVSELVTNGVVHAGGTLLAVGLRYDDEWLEVSVADGGPWPVQQRQPRHDLAGDIVMLVQMERHLGQQLDERQGCLDLGDAATLAVGRGLSLVETLADDWGVMPKDDGKVVWARFALTKQTPGQDDGGDDGLDGVREPRQPHPSAGGAAAQASPEQEP